MRSKSGYPGDNISSRNTNLFSTLTNLSLIGLITTARVKSIVLDENHPRFKELGEWNSLGTIEYDSVENPSPNSNIYPIAKPLANLKNYPLLNEIVYLISLPSTNLETFTNAQISYYIDIVSLWNHPHHNAFPSDPNQLADSQQKDYTETQAGSVRRITDNSTEIKLGNTFKERTNIHPLLPFEGDIIYEGRWGNSIRFGSTVKNRPNNWSVTGENGDSITIIRNGQPIDSNDEGWKPIVEDINKDQSSIYLTSTQKIPLKAVDTNYKSYQTKPDAPNQYQGEQIILNSGRLVFNSKTDHILFSSPKSIGVSANSFNVNTENTIIDSNKIQLGSNKAKQPIILGNKFLKDFDKLLSNMNTLCTVLQSLVSLPPGSPFVSLILPATQTQATILEMKGQIESYKSKITYSD